MNLEGRLGRGVEGEVVDQRGRVPLAGPQPAERVCVCARERERECV